MQTATIFMSGEHQAIRLPSNLHVAGQEVYVKAMGNAIILIPIEHCWEPLFESLGLFSDDFMVTRSQPKVQEREQSFSP